MSAIGVLYALLFYTAFLVLIIGVGKKIYQYATVPAPLKIAVTPAPKTKAGVVLRLTKEVVFFASLFRSNKWTWIFGWLFHFCLLLVLLRHLRYFTDPVWFWVDLIQPFGKYAAFGMVAGLAGLWVRRLLVDRVRYITSLSDHLMLALLMGIAITGLGMKYVLHTDIILLKEFAQGLLYFDSSAWKVLPADPFLLLHLTLVIVLMFIFPISKLLHVPGLFFSPTRNQVDNPREKRHISPWATELEAEKNKMQAS